jgi:hypothetical protein
MGYPVHQVSYDYKQYFDRAFTIIGDNPYYDKIHVEGDLKNMDFLAYYADEQDKISMVVGSPS